MVPMDCVLSLLRGVGCPIHFFYFRHIYIYVISEKNIIVLVLNQSLKCKFNRNTMEF